MISNVIVNAVVVYKVNNRSFFFSFSFPSSSGLCFFFAVKNYFYFYKKYKFLSIFCKQFSVKFKLIIK